MKLDELEKAALRLDPKARARLAERLLRSLEALTPAETEALWVEEAERRDAEIDADPSRVRPAVDVMRDARSKLG